MCWCWRVSVQVWPPACVVKLKSFCNFHFLLCFNGKPLMSVEAVTGVEGQALNLCDNQ